MGGWCLAPSLIPAIAPVPPLTSATLDRPPAENLLHPDPYPTHPKKPTAALMLKPDPTEGQLNQKAWLRS